MGKRVDRFPPLPSFHLLTLRVFGSRHNPGRLALAFLVSRDCDKVGRSFLAAPIVALELGAARSELRASECSSRCRSFAMMLGSWGPVSRKTVTARLIYLLNEKEPVVSCPCAFGLFSLSAFWSCCCSRWLDSTTVAPQDHVGSQCSGQVASVGLSCLIPYFALGRHLPLNNTKPFVYSASLVYRLRFFA